MNRPLLCGGALFTPNKVITAAHCVKETHDNIQKCVGTKCSSRVDVTCKEQCEKAEYEKIKLIANRLDNSKTSVEEKGVDFVVAGIEMFAFDPETINRDVAILTVQPTTETKQFQQRLKTIKFDKIGIEKLLDKDVFVVGFGKTSGDGKESNLLKVATLRILDESTCRKFLERTKTKFNMDMGLCATSLPGKKDTLCQGDSGGPLFYKDGQDFRIVGVASFNEEGCKAEFPTYFQRVSYFEKRIQKHINE